MKKRMALGLGLAISAGLAPRLWAQIPVAPAPAAPALVAPGAVAPAPAPAAAPFSLWSFLGLTPEFNAACMAKLCYSPFGQLLTNSMRPVSVFSGGIISGCCPTVPTD